MYCTMKTMNVLSARTSRRTGVQKCMLVIRAEDGLLSDLESIFKDVFRNYCRPEGVLPASSVILIGSASHVSLLGLATYAEDYVRVNNNIIAACSNGVTV